MTAEQPRDLRPGGAGQAISHPGPEDPAPEIGEVVASVTAEDGTNLITVSRRVETAGPGAAQTVVAVAGEIDQDTADLVQRALRQALDGHRPVCCDLRGVTFFGAAAAHMLLGAHRDAERTGRVLILRGAGGITARVLDTVDPDRTVPWQRAP